jgi:hypothetical protein
MVAKAAMPVFIGALLFCAPRNNHCGVLPQTARTRSGPPLLASRDTFFRFIERYA